MLASLAASAAAFSNPLIASPASSVLELPSSFFFSYCFLLIT